ncbi:MAG: EAL domain-containing protein, partial [Thermoanaerobaculia bacterium]|nr:EAL domain-containing protein [Thermoanaerobaculia bacterium]
QNDEFVLHYQPLIDVDTGKPFGVEALIRWAHPTIGIIPPGDFIPLAEETGLIVQIGEWVLATACREIANIQKVMGPEFSVSVNLSPRQFYQQEFPKRVAQEIESCEIYPTSLMLEITESDAMRNAETTIETMSRLKRVGVKLAVDDFGTGYSSLDYLKRFPIDALKLDRTFVKDVDTDHGDAAIATAVIAMAHSLGLKVVAEGVENEAQLGFLRQQRCDQIQGFFYSRALSYPDLRTFLTSGGEEAEEETLPS